MKKLLLAIASCMLLMSFTIASGKPSTKEVAKFENESGFFAKANLCRAILDGVLERWYEYGNGLVQLDFEHVYFHTNEGWQDYVWWNTYWWDDFSFGDWYATNNGLASSLCDPEDDYFTPLFPMPWWC